MQLLIAALATWQVVEIWHHSLLMAPLRARTEMWTGKLGELLACPWCLSVWVGFGCGAALSTGYRGLYVILFGFACSRLANLANDLTHSHCRTPRIGIDISAWEAQPELMEEDQPTETT